MKPLRYLSLFSGIEAATVAWKPLGFECVAVAEIEPFPCAVLKHWYPQTQNLGDVSKHHEWPQLAIDLLVGGPPCQAFSVAGLRAGMADPRGNLTLTYLAVVDQYRPTWVVFENVPGIHSSWSDEADGRETEASRKVASDARALGISLGIRPDEFDDLGGFEEVDQTNAFDCFVAGLEELGYGVATRILDAQYFGLAQRRERVFAVAHIGGLWQRAAAVLFDEQSLRGDPPPSREARQRIAPDVAPSLRTGCSPSGHGHSAQLRGDGGDSIVAAPLTGRPYADTAGREDRLMVDVCPTLRAGGNKTGGDRPPGTDVDTADSLIPVVMAHGQANAEQTEDHAPTLNCNHEAPILFTFPSNMSATQAQEKVEQNIAVAFKSSHYTRDKDGAPQQTTTPLSADADKGDQDTLVLAPIAIQDTRPMDKAQNGIGINEDGVAYTLDSQGNQGVGQVHAFQPRIARNGRGDMGADVVSALQAQSGESGKGDAAPCVAVQGTDMVVRRLTPTECERLQGFQDGYTAIPMPASATVKAAAESLGTAPKTPKIAADGPRYKALGNSMAVPCMRWIGERIAMVDEIQITPQ